MDWLSLSAEPASRERNILFQAARIESADWAENSLASSFTSFSSIISWDADQSERWYLEIRANLSNDSGSIHIGVMLLQNIHQAVLHCTVRNQKISVDEFLFKFLKFSAKTVVTSPAGKCLDTRHQVVYDGHLNVGVEAPVLVLLQPDVQEAHKALDCGALNEAREEDHG